jgi:hypothetical protein
VPPSRSAASRISDIDNVAEPAAEISRASMGTS